MNGLNRVTLLGNLAADPELKMTQGGTSVLKLRVACNERYKDRNDQWQDRTEFVNVIVWGKRAEGLHKYLAKGSGVLAEGALRSSSYEDRDGNKRYKTEVVASNVIMVGGGNGGSGRQEEPPRDTQRRPQRQAPPPADDDGPPPDLPDDDLPF